MRLDPSAQTSQDWRIHDLISDFRLLDVWRLPTPGGPDDFPRLVRQSVAFDPAHSASRPVRALFALRWKMGEIFGWDRPGSSPPPTLRDRLPEDLRANLSAPDHEALPFSTLYLTDREWAAEIVNRTVHGVMHLGWVEDEPGQFRGQMAVYVKPNGFLGKVYLAVIAPFRHLVVYPAMIREMARRWDQP